MAWNTVIPSGTRLLPMWNSKPLVRAGVGEVSEDEEEDDDME